MRVEGAGFRVQGPGFQGVGSTVVSEQRKAVVPAPVCFSASDCAMYLLALSCWLRVKLLVMREVVERPCSLQVIGQLLEHPDWSNTAIDQYELIRLLEQPPRVKSLGMR